MELKKILNLDTDEVQAGELRIRAQAKPDYAKMSCWALCLWSRGFRQILTWHESAWPRSISWSSTDSNQLRVSHFCVLFLWDKLCTGTWASFSEITFDHYPFHRNFWRNRGKFCRAIMNTRPDNPLCQHLSHMKTNNVPCFSADRPTSQGNKHPRSRAVQSHWVGAANPPLTTSND